MFIYVTTTGGTLIGINPSAITNFKRVSSDMTYIEFYAFDGEYGKQFFIERIETRESFDSIRHQITEVLHQSQPLLEARNRR